ncbi:unannotated protein [freshwater metagenome]|uniref:Unannotated protein n=1 Tax=freshwater metagenome TaxID=449393 RepID=A0A6J7UVW4_9ZZZZ|nr:hypothetical protein [Actinomycetota bacterium]MSV64184.1 hypothetical protein [Actinomycetota bacterium]MSW25935.1 hypothetical protein [Actinomycetota bacterium]MSW33930.1 hypothetical protein [Actinomycetota bacterium]MSX30915.1 hypothetical protein [Actinomycetota bacterium]
MIAYTITSGTPTLQELEALEYALELHHKPEVIIQVAHSAWAKPLLRKTLPKKF